MPTSKYFIFWNTSFLKKKRLPPVFYQAIRDKYPRKALFHFLKYSDFEKIPSARLLTRHTWQKCQQATISWDARAPGCRCQWAARQIRNCPWGSRIPRQWPRSQSPGFELTKPKAQAIASELESHQTRRTSKETQDETQDTPPKIDQKTVRKTLGVLKKVLLVENDSNKCTLNAWGVKNTFCGFQNWQPHAGREAKFFLTPEKCPDLNGKVVEIYKTKQFHCRGVVKTRKSVL